MRGLPRLPGAWVAAGVLLAAALLAGVPVPVAAQPLMADLSSHIIAITSGFTGTEVVLFGSTDGGGDVAVVVTGPRVPVTVRRKDRMAGIWINHESVTFDQVPSYYRVAVSRPLNLLSGAPLLERHGIGLDHLHLEPAEAVAPAGLAPFRDALIRSMQASGHYGPADGQVTFLGDRLFRTSIYFPANVPTGLYNVEVFLFRDGDVESAQTTPLVVAKVGFGAEVSEFSRGQPLMYGLIGVLGAVAAGWLAGAVFRRA